MGRVGSGSGGGWGGGGNLEGADHGHDCRGEVGAGLVSTVSGFHWGKAKDRDGKSDRVKDPLKGLRGLGSAKN